MSWAPEVVADSTGKWCGNALRFATREEAEGNVADLRSRWMMVTDTRVVESSDPVNYRWVNGALVAVSPPINYENGSFKNHVVEDKPR